MRFEVNLEYTLVRSEKYSSKLDIFRSLIRILQKQSAKGLWKQITNVTLLESKILKASVRKILAASIRKRTFLEVYFIGKCSF